jgi:hypothetical protein
VFLITVSSLSFRMPCFTSTTFEITPTCRARCSEHALLRARGLGDGHTDGDGLRLPKSRRPTSRADLSARLAGRTPMGVLPW